MYVSYAKRCLFKETCFQILFVHGTHGDIHWPPGGLPMWKEGRSNMSTASGRKTPMNVNVSKAIVPNGRPKKNKTKGTPTAAYKDSLPSEQTQKLHGRKTFCGSLAEVLGEELLNPRYVCCRDNNVELLVLLLVLSATAGEHEAVDVGRLTFSVDLVSALAAQPRRSRGTVGSSRQWRDIFLRKIVYKTSYVEEHTPCEIRTCRLWYIPGTSQHAFQTGVFV